MDILEDSTESNVSGSLELDRFKEKIRGLWLQMLQETYNKYHADDDSEDSISEEQYMAENALKFADEPEPVDEIDELMGMLDSMMEETDEQEEIKSEGKAPIYKGQGLKANNEKTKVEATKYEGEHTGNLKSIEETSKSVKGGRYEGVESGRMAAKKVDKVSRKYSPLVEELKEELRSLQDRQRIGRRKMRFRL